VLELEEEVRKLQARLRDIIQRKAPVILREQLQEMEAKYGVMSKELEGYKDKEEKFVQRVDHIKFTLKQ
jgi:7-cyano-7-deazaguanine synthase in queuosine biosynthesis